MTRRRCTPTSSTSPWTTGSPSRARVTVLGTPVDLREVDVDAYVVAGIADHITPWQNCYRSTPAARRRRPGSCCPPAATSRPWSTRPATPRRPTRTTKDTNRPTRSSGSRRRGHRAGQLVARLRGLARPSAAVRERHGTATARRRRLPAAGRGPRHLRLRQLRTAMYDNIGRSLGTDYFHIADQLTDDRARLLAAHQGLRRRRGAAGHQRLLGARRTPVAADQAAGRARHRRRRHRRLRLPGDEPARRSG